MPAQKKSKRKVSPTDEDLDSGAEQISRTNRDYVSVAGFFDTGFPGSLYGIWRRDVSQLMREIGALGPQKAATDRWSTLPWHAAGLPTMAPRGMINYCSDNSIVHAVNKLCQDIAKKVRNGEAACNRPIKVAKTAYGAQYPGDPTLALADDPPPLDNPKKQVLVLTSSAPSTTKTSRTVPISQANADLFALLSKRPGALEAPAIAYRPVGAPPQGGGGPSSAIMHMI